MKTFHDKQKDYKCHYCQKPFGQAEDLKNHVDTIHEKSLKASSPPIENIEEKPMERRLIPLL